MQRELKFRVWNKHAKCFVNDDVEFYSTMNLLDLFKFFKDYSQIDDFIIQQYTGLKDKNGKEIYEGDIVHYLFDGDSYPKEAVDEFLVCGYELENAWFVFTDDIGYGYYWMEISGRCEVVGNIFE
jgi:uncharacterized phage protein (TIGR01671 family)